MILFAVRESRTLDFLACKNSIIFDIVNKNNRKFLTCLFESVESQKRDNQNRQITSS